MRRACAIAVAFALAGCGGRGDHGTAGDAGPDVQRPRDEIFDPDVVQEIALDIAPVDLERMHAALPEVVLVPATFHWNDVTLDMVGVRYKGNSSVAPSQMHKRSCFIDFNGFVPGQKLDGLPSLALDNGVQFGSLFSERLVTDILRKEQVPASRANYARLSINGTYMGLYVNVERINKPFLARHYSDASGNLYKCDEGGPGCDLAYLGDDGAAYTGLSAKSNEDTADRADLAALARLLDQTADADLVPALRASFDLEGFRRLTAVLLLAGAFDQYTGFQAHNYYLYREPDSGRWTYLPWDLDVAFADNAFGRIAVLDGWNAAYPLPVVPRPLLERLVADAGWLADYRRTAAEVLEAYFRPDDLGAHLDALYAQAAPHLADDPFPHVRVTNPEDESYEQVVAALEGFMRKRYDRAKAELADPKITPPMDGGSGGGVPPPGPASPQDPTELRVDGITGGKVALSWKDNAPDDVGTIVQKCLGAMCSDFMNFMGLPGANVTHAEDPTAMAGATYRYRVYAIRRGPMGPVGTGPSNVVAATP